MTSSDATNVVLRPMRSPKCPNSIAPKGRVRKATEKVRKALLGGYAHSRVLELHGQRMTNRNFVPGGKVRSHKKDIEIVMTVAREIGVYLPGTALLSHLWNALASQGGLDWDHSSLIKVLEMMSQTVVKGE